MKPLSLSDLSGSQSRTYAVRAITDEQIGRRVHVAIARWEKPWRGGGPLELNGWIIVGVDSRGKQIVRDSSSPEENVDHAVLAELREVLAEMRASPKQTWVVTGRRRMMLRSLLEDNGFDVTGSFAEQNRASKRASGLLRKKRTALKERKRRTGPKESDRPALWLPNSSRTEGKGGNLTISCDASSDTQSIGSMCFVASNGDYQLRTRRTTASVDELELEAITLALKYSSRVAASSAVIESDSESALDAVAAIRRSGARGKRWRGVSAGSQSRFAQALKDAQKVGKVSIRRVLGHAGDPLNQAADQIAYLGFRASVHPREVAEAPLRQGINQALAKARKGLAP